MSSSNLVEVVAGVIREHVVGRQFDGRRSRLECDCGAEVIAGDGAAHQARAVLDALAEAGNVEWGVQGKTFVDEGWDHVWTKGFDGQPLTKDSAKNHLWLKSPAPFRLVSRLTLPWTVAE